jgi:protein tyrosine/serine phosphatase
MISPIAVSGTRNLVLRGPSPQSDVDWEKLRSMGIHYALDLQTGSGIMLDGSPLEEQVTADRHFIRSYSHPLGEFFPPTRAELELAAKFIESREGVYVHCKQGVDRTGIVFGYFRMTRQGWSKVRAVREMCQMGMHPWFFYWAWVLRP